jgi:hypothetical protein
LWEVKTVRGRCALDHLKRAHPPTAACFRLAFSVRIKPNGPMVELSGNLCNWN